MSKFKDWIKTHHTYPFYKELEDVNKLYAESIARDFADFVNTETIDEGWINDWILLWPSKQKLNSFGVKRINDPDKARTKLKTFLKEFYKKTGLRISNEEKAKKIMEVTALYIKDFNTGRHEWKYISEMCNFINHRDKGSKLASLIQEEPQYQNNKTFIG